MLLSRNNHKYNDCRFAEVRKASSENHNAIHPSSYSNRICYHASEFQGTTIQRAFSLFPHMRIPGWTNWNPDHLSLRLYCGFAPGHMCYTKGNAPPAHSWTESGWSRTYRLRNQWPGINGLHIDSSCCGSVKLYCAEHTANWSNTSTRTYPSIATCPCLTKHPVNYHTFPFRLRRSSWLAVMVT